MDLFDELVSLASYSIDSSIDVYCARVAFIHSLNIRLHNFQSQWNNHSLSTMRQKTTNQLFVSGAMRHARGNYVETGDMLAGEEDDFNESLLYEDDWLLVEDEGNSAISLPTVMTVPLEVERNVMDIVDNNTSKDLTLAEASILN